MCKKHFTDGEALVDALDEGEGAKERGLPLVEGENEGAKKLGWVDGASDGDVVGRGVGNDVTIGAPVGAFALGISLGT